ncbi:hypothetical protein SK236_17890 [Pseudomonas aeruginosa]|nr:hypothetical protein [Pseudomonas aeruginosa]MDX8097803.1 hypothetical protein [Pseudomonas aeruginosa]
MNLSTLLSNLCSRVPGEDLTDKQILSIKSDLGSARNAAQNMALGVAAVGNLLANVGAEGEVGPGNLRASRLVSGGDRGAIFMLVELEQVCTERINRQKEAQQ